MMSYTVSITTLLKLKSRSSICDGSASGESVEESTSALLDGGAGGNTVAGVDGATVDLKPERGRSVLPAGSGTNAAAGDATSSAATSVRSDMARNGRG